jgi:F0F1-type ATP synthase assembly protein I
MTIRTEKPDSTLHTMSQGLRDLVAFSNLGYQLVAVILVCFGIGYGIDYVANTSPILCISFSVLGIAAGMYLVIRSAEMKSHKQNQEHEL